MSGFRIPQPKNEPVYSYAPGSPERAKLKKAIEDLKSNPVDIPMVIGGKEVRTSKKTEIRAPHNHSLKLGEYSKGTEEEVKMAVKAAMDAKQKWADMPYQHRLGIFLKAADLLAGPYRYIMNAATMLAHSKNVFQAEIDGVCELIDFYRYNPFYAQMIYDMQPGNAPMIWDRMEYRPLEGFVFAVTPFNFVSIGGNLPTSPAMMGNTVVWKPASTGVYTAHIVMQVMKEAGLPDGVINMVTAPGAAIGELVLKSRDLAGVHFTGSTPVFQNMWKVVGENIANYKSYPRIVGETGGKDFVFVHSSAEPYATATALFRGAYEYQGQKCSAVSRAYIPKSLWSKIKEIMLKFNDEAKMGDVEDFSVFVNAVIDKGAFDSIVEYIDYAKESDEANFIFGGNYDDSKGYFIEPTMIETGNPHFKLMEEEIFGPVLTVYIYDDNAFEETLKLCDETSPYALTGAVFARDREAIVRAEKVLTHAAGNFYINDKPTGAVVGQQPFGGARASGTNDKAGSLLNLIRWCSPRAIKENFVPPKDYKYPFMEKE
ncbi:MAG: L-glutamate gamma-semialdehyde dehydrogenase [candidate division Zixibacteria bacterium]|nr:L-glutamate gamma-semialdehyde dehydrogenase [candidate division Zixibacteria bacterium]NIR62873.1 L-glutamate gamma-semialdehyde dehydrogenase [candidate division Zixibacteria bacterium]NIS15981.1 L-glutamate gamma-semialdehyde dehydrogenase [candidate division Zixibacteria bacterium]NIS44888.1 L-glutamate gamma-semialdehyde dehydrogenase [candidate division Zixibacteria bacterium]NIT52390.1 L-glutamate gamma-semialdehyde dehydrogenase [candidate division Zixibacteria bacterium]